MNPSRDSFLPVTDLQIDRLVDGECTEAERRAILLGLESDPDGWRRCALAFLEDQALRSILGGPASPIPLVRPSPSTLIPKARRTSTLLVRLALAAGLFAATFSSGFFVGGATRSRDAIEVARADLPEVSESPTEVDDSIREVGWATVGDGSGEGSTANRVPILAGSGINEKWLRSRSSTVPDYLRAQWEREGFQVAEKLRLMSLNLDDGRRLAIPVANVEVEYVGQDTY